MRGFMPSLIVAFVVASVLADSRAPQHVVTGTVLEFHAGEWMSVANATTDPTGFSIALRETTAYESRDHNSVLDPAALKSGVRVTVWFRSVGERRYVADKVGRPRHFSRTHLARNHEMVNGENHPCAAARLF